MPLRRVNPTTRQMLTGIEALELKAYRDAGGVWTVGYGHTGPDVYPGLVITPQRAEELLVGDLSVACRAVERLCPVPLGENQFGALVSFCYNAGQGALQNSTLRRRVNAQRFDLVATRLSSPVVVRDHKGRDNFVYFSGELMRWTKIQGATSRGLIYRRSLEAALWCTPDGAVPVWPRSPDRP